MLTVLATISRGETFSWSLTPRQTGETARAALREGSTTGVKPGTSEAVVASVVESTVDGQPGWTFTLSAAQTAALLAPMYVLDERITMNGGGVQITDGSAVLLVDAATGPGA